MIKYEFHLSSQSKECSLFDFYNIIKNNKHIVNNFGSLVNSEFEFYYINTKGNICYSRCITGTYYKTIGNDKIINYDRYNNILSFGSFNERINKKDLLNELKNEIIFQRRNKIKKLCQSI